jgi:hypothetical protein
MVAIVVAISLLTTSMVVIQTAYALTRYFNCTTGIVNRTHQLTMQDITTFMIKKFQDQVIKENMKESLFINWID